MKDFGGVPLRLGAVQVPDGAVPVLVKGSLLNFRAASPEPLLNGGIAIAA